MAKKRKNKAIPLIVLVLILAGLMIGYSALSQANDRREAEELAAEEAANAVTMIAEYDYTTTSKLSYQPAGSEKLTFLAGAGAWTYADDAKFPLNQTIVTQMAAAISQIGVVTEVTEGTAADYGLDEPLYTIEIAYSDGTAHTYKIGDYNSFNGANYFSMDGDMYMVASALTSYFDYTLEDLLKTDTVPAADWAELGYVNEITVSDSTNTAVITEDEAKSAAIDVIGSVRLTNCADYYADDSEKAAYGLTSGASVTVKYKKAVTTTDESGNENTTYLDTAWT
ncbi:MAG: DUF4340 domain-containing protein, partial [Clostridia bacterium]|nr:DUF4340 domain-containing protein [Clostridia bacterium]